MQHLKLYGLLAVLFVMAACTKEPESPAVDRQAEHYIQQADQEIAEAEAAIDAFVAEWIGTRSTVTVPAGSVDALADAIAEAGPGGTVILEAGDHTENAPVLIEHRVKIEGEDGATVLFPNSPEPQGVPVELIPGLHVKNAERVWLKNFSITTGTGLAGRVGVLIQKSPRTRVEGLNLVGFQYGVYIDGGNKCQMLNNTLVGAYAEHPSTGQWGIANAAGIGTVLMRNDFSNYAVGIFFSDRNGLAFYNTATGLDIGILWCTVPPWQHYPDGTYSEAAESARACRGYYNTSVGCIWSFLVIDGANNSVLIQNESIAPIWYDIELAAASERFGFPAPTSAKSLVISVGAFIDYGIKDCTGDNTIIGGVLIDNEADPCF